MKTKTFVAKRIVLLSLLIVAGLLFYYQFLYKSPRVDKGLVKLVSTFKGHNNIVNAVRFLPGDSLVVSGSVDSTIKIWNRSTGVVVKTIQQPGGITYLDLSSYGNNVITGSYDGVIRIWDLNSGTLLKSLSGHQGTVWTVAFSPDGRLVASGGDDREIRVWEVASGKLLQTFKGHELTVWSVKFSPTGKELVSCSYDCTWKVWEIESAKIIVSNKDHSQAIVDIAFNPSGNMLATSSDDGSIRLWSMPSGAMVRKMEVPEHVQAVAFSPDSKLLLTGGRDKPMIGELLQNFLGDSKINKGVSARLWDVHTGELLHTFSEQGNDVNDVAFSNNGNWMATASADYSIHVWQKVKM